jgi:hypothetical protein
MRVLLAAVDAQKGDLDGNLARHLAMLEQARAQGCDLAVFPEFSLTGSVDPRRHPERALSVDAEPVRALLQGTFRSGVAAVFGIAERAGPAFHITQVFGHGGRLGGVYRKRHLAEGEEDYSTREGAGVFQLGAARFGVTLCAEGEQVGPWIGRRHHTFWLGRWMTQRDRWVLCRADPFEVDPGHVATLSAEGVRELRSSATVTTPRSLPELLDRIAAGDPPDGDEDLGV